MCKAVRFHDSAKEECKFQNLEQDDSPTSVFMFEAYRLKTGEDTSDERAAEYQKKVMAEIKEAYKTSSLGQELTLVCEHFCFRKDESVEAICCHFPVPSWRAHSINVYRFWLASIVDRFLVLHSKLIVYICILWSSNNIQAKSDLLINTRQIKILLKNI